MLTLLMLSIRILETRQLPICIMTTRVLCGKCTAHASAFVRKVPSLLARLATSAGGLASEGVILQRAAETRACWLPSPVWSLWMSALPQLMKKNVGVLGMIIGRTCALNGDLLDFGGNR